MSEVKKGVIGGLVFICQIIDEMILLMLILNW